MPLTFLNIKTFALTLRARERLFLPPYLGSTLRGGFGHAFRRISCVLRRQECSNCLLRGKCVYSYVFETPPPTDSAMMRLYPSVPHPFVLQPPARSKEQLAAGEELDFGLVLIGRAVDLEPYFVLAFSELGEMGLGRGRGKFDLARVDLCPLDGERRTIYRNGDEQLADSGAGQTLPLRVDEPSGDLNEIALWLETPLRIKFQEQLNDSLPFHVLIRSLLRRISALAYFHGGGPIDLDYRRLIEQAESVRTVQPKLRWHDWERYSSRQDTRMKLGGLMGSVRYAGDLAPFLSLLRLGEVVHVGKNATFGLGRFRMNIPQERDMHDAGATTRRSDPGGAAA